MFEGLKKNLYFFKMQLLFNKGIIDKKIIPFDDEFYNKMNNTIINGLPVSIHIKYLKPLVPPGKCYDRSLYMFFCFNDALLVCGDSKYLELEYGANDVGHSWIEIGNYVYDPSLLLRFDKDLYYRIYMPTNVSKCTIKEYCSDNDTKKNYYEEVKTTTIKDLQPNGKKRVNLITSIPLVKAIAQMSEKQEFIDDLNNFLALIQYEDNEVIEELNKKIKLVKYTK